MPSSQNVEYLRATQLKNHNEPTGMDYSYQQLFGSDVGLLKGLLKMFAEAFGESGTYQDAVPSDSYLRSLLTKPDFIALAARGEDGIVGGLVAYELEKFEQQRREIYIYDLAVVERHRRRGIARTLIEELKKIARQHGAYVMFVQADRGDTAAVRLYESLGTRQDVYHFDIPVYE